MINLESEILRIRTVASTPTSPQRFAKLKKGTFGRGTSQKKKETCLRPTGPCRGSDMLQRGILYSASVSDSICTSSHTSGGSSPFSSDCISRLSRQIFV